MSPRKRTLPTRPTIDAMDEQLRADALAIDRATVVLSKGEAVPGIKKVLSDFFDAVARTFDTKERNGAEEFGRRFGVDVFTLVADTKDGRALRKEFFSDPDLMREIRKQTSNIVLARREALLCQPATISRHRPKPL